MSDLALNRLKIGGALFFATLLLSGAAVYNGYPLIYADTGGYLGLQALSFRSFFYNLFIYPSIWFHSLWPVVFVQSFFMAYLLRLVLRIVFDIKRSQTYLYIILFLCLATSLPWFTSFVMPDIFTGILVLSLYLLLMCRELLSLWEKGALFVLTIGAALLHSTHIPLAGAVILMVWICQLITKKWQALPRPALVIPTVALFMALTLVLVNNHRIWGIWTFSPGGYAFILARLVADGPATDYLKRYCPEKGYALCRYQDELPADSDTFLWSDHGPFRQVGWIDGYQNEGKNIIWGTILHYPSAVTKECLKNTLLQLIKVLTFRRPYLENYVTNPIRSYFPGEYRAYIDSLQSRNKLFLLEYLNFLHIAVYALALFVAVAAFYIFRRRRQYNPIFFLIFIAFVYLLQAFITGCLSVPHHRFGSRLVWLFPFFAMASLAHIFQYRHQHEKKMP